MSIHVHHKCQALIQLPTVLVSAASADAKCVDVKSAPVPLCTAAADSSAQPPEGGTAPPARAAGLTVPLPGCSTSTLLLLLPACTTVAPTPARAVRQPGSTGLR